MLPSVPADVKLLMRLEGFKRLIADFFFPPLWSQVGVPAWYMACTGIIDRKKGHHVEKPAPQGDLAMALGSLHLGEPGAIVRSTSQLICSLLLYIQNKLDDIKHLSDDCAYM